MGAQHHHRRGLIGLSPVRPEPRIIGQLHGGSAACGNTASDWYGAFGNSWSGLSSILDPLGTGATTLNGYDPNSGPLPTCTDGIQNQGETGIDCGGPCAPCPCTGTNVTVSITFDNYPEETSWTIRQGTTTVASGGPYGSQPDGSTSNTVVCLANGCYDFTINDSYGDGLCCAYGNGSYTVSSAAGTHASGGTFTTSQTTNFCVGGTTATSRMASRTRAKQVLIAAALARRAQPARMASRTREKRAWIAAAHALPAQPAAMVS